MLYDGPILDAHTHLWEFNPKNYPWLAPSSDFGPEGLSDSLRRDYLPADYERDVRGQGVVASVHVEAGWEPSTTVDETRWLETLDKSNNIAVRYVAGAPFAAPNGSEIVAEQSAFERVVGVRQTLAWSPDFSKTMATEPEISRTVGWRSTLATVHDLALFLEVLIYPWQAGEVLEIARLLPGLIIVVNHALSPIDQSRSGIQLWRNSIRALAEAPNIRIKLSSIQGYLDDPTAESTAWVMRDVLEAFSGDRVMIASDFPVGGRRFSFGEVFDQYRMAVRDYSPLEQRSLFHDNAAALYQIDTD
jgi:predicted TIM-barrel fold metal-dependent hydrolase